MIDEMEKYRAKIERRFRRGRTGARYVDGGRRSADYKSPPFFTLGFIVQFLTVIIGGLILLVIAGCATIKRTFLGG